ncbi:ergot alkaloid biosynthesis protein [Pseudonocardia sp. MH-G8]|uniref:ergot alkaloid biosynthesis protein n=1 Tax=Pseudonocardia sp. MH-G8 TaxID=1854588 RepID=UPI000BA1094E|nr:ergot alkaloid biosynthesis protein [Pseudonocardia sp. MH-G8]OZM80769.1 ergot alkaloid biosynthesis protein [Pseudonocardia sp. MH-G8]
MTALVTGATGTTGSRVAELLERSGAAVRRVSRSSPVRFDWFDPATHDAAFDGIERLYLVAPIGEARPAAVVAPVLDRAVRRGLRRVALLSSSAVERGEGGLGELHDLVARTVPEPVVLRPSWFTQNFVSRNPGVRSLWSGEVVTATGDGRVPFVDAGDIAAVAAAVLQAPSAPEPDLVITGLEALTYDEVCRLWTELTGDPVRHIRMTEQELAARFVADGLPADFATVLAALDGIVAADTQSTVTATVPELTGRPARTVHETLTSALTPQRST